MATEDAEIEAAAKRAYEASEGFLREGENPLPWESKLPETQDYFRVLALAAQPPLKLCGTCRWWGSLSDDDPRTERRICNRIPHLNAAEDGSDLIGPSLEEKAGTFDGPDDVSGVYCRADFGCILHQSTEAKPDA